MEDIEIFKLLWLLHYGSKLFNVDDKLTNYVTMVTE